MSDIVILIIVLGVLLFISSLLRGNDPPHGPYGFV